MNSIRAGESAKRFYILGTWVKVISLKRLIRSMASSWYDMSWVSLVFHSPIPLSKKKSLSPFHNTHGKHPALDPELLLQQSTELRKSG